MPRTAACPHRRWYHRDGCHPWHRAARSGHCDFLGDGGVLRSAQAWPHDAMGPASPADPVWRAAGKGIWRRLERSHRQPAGAEYLRKAGVRAGHGLLEIYSAINAGSVGRYSATLKPSGRISSSIAFLPRPRWRPTPRAIRPSPSVLDYRGSEPQADELRGLALALRLRSEVLLRRRDSAGTLDDGSVLSRGTVFWPFYIGAG